MSKDWLLSSIALSLFIICPRMAGMVQIIAGHSRASLVGTAVAGTIMALPLIIVMVLVFARFGLWGALAFCVLTDLGAALMMKQVSFRAGLETLVIAVFVVIGVKTAPYICNLFIR